MIDPLLAPFTSPSRHVASAEIIRSHSTNRSDIREVALEGLDLGSIREVLELGCGFGFMAKTVAGRVHPEARIVGVDACPENGPAFLNSVRSSGRVGEFISQHIGAELPWENSRFDLVLSTYSLYYFVQVLPEVARILRPDGLFLAITHSRTSFQGLVEATQLAPQASPILKLIGRFAAENAPQLLAVHFDQVERVDYPNRLVFTSEHLRELMIYVQFKLPLLLPSERSCQDIPEWMAKKLKASLEAPGGLIIEKDDAVFRCWRPKCQ